MIIMVRIIYKVKGKINIIIRNNNYSNKCLKFKKKKDEISKSNIIHLSNYKSFKNKTQFNGFYSFTGKNKININKTLKKKMKRNNHYILMNRSPFLTNKF